MVRLPVPWLGAAAREVVGWVCDGGYRHGDEDEKRGVLEALLWMLMMTVVAGVLDLGNSGEGEETWVVVRTREVAQRLGLADWDDARQVLERFPWVEAWHGKRGRVFWEMCTGLEVVGFGTSGDIIACT